MEDFQRINRLAGIAIANGFAHEVIALNEVLAFDLRFNLQHPKISAVYMLETPINGCNFEVVKRDGSRYHTGADIAAKILGEERAYMANLEQMATMAKDQQGLIKKFCRKCDLFSRIFPEEAAQDMMKERAKQMQEQYMGRAAGVMSRLASADKSLPEPEIETAVPSQPAVSAAVSGRIRSKLRANCEIQYAVAQAHLPRWLDFLASKEGQILSKTEVFTDSDPTGILRLTARAGKLALSRDGEVVGEWDNWEDARKFLALGTNTLPNPVLPLTQASYDRTTDGIPADVEVLKQAIRAQVSASICDEELWNFLNG